MENNDFRVVDVDPSDYLDSPQAIAAYLDDAVASGDGKILAYCLGQVARAAGMGSIANVSGMNRQSLYKSLSGTAAPRVDTLLAVLRALGVEMHFTAPASALRGKIWQMTTTPTG